MVVIVNLLICAAVLWARGNVARLVAPVPPALQFDPGNSSPLAPLRHLALDDDGDLPHLRQEILAPRGWIGFRAHSLYI